MKTISEKYLHINNGGVNFLITDEGLGPTLNISATHFGHLTNAMKIHVTRDVLQGLAEIFAKAAEYDGYSKEYVCAIELPGESTGCCGGECFSESKKQTPDESLKEVLQKFEGFRQATLSEEKDEVAYATGLLKKCDCDGCSSGPTHTGVWTGGEKR